MSRETITKNFPFVILLLVFCIFFSGCFSTIATQSANDNRASKNVSQRFGKSEVVGTIKSGEITESSGLVASKCQEDVFWTHNDSGDDAFVFAIARQGEKLGTFSVKGAKNVDWEDIATIKKPNGECVLYIGDIGNNLRARGEMIIYIVKEPTVSAANKNSSRKNPVVTEAARAIRFDYPDIRHDAESLMVHPATGDIYVLSKRLQGASGVYKLAANFDFNRTNRLEKIADFTVPAMPNGFLTGGDIASDGRHAIICDYFAAYEISLPDDAKNFDDIWKQNPEVVELGERGQGEAVCYSPDDKAIYATSENKNSPLIEVKRK